MLGCWDVGMLGCEGVGVRVSVMVVGVLECEGVRVRVLGLGC